MPGCTTANDVGDRDNAPFALSHCFHTLSSAVSSSSIKSSGCSRPAENLISLPIPSSALFGVSR
jgi:hypothetical protein